MTHTVNWVHCKRSERVPNSFQFHARNVTPKWCTITNMIRGLSGITSHGFCGINFRFDANSTRLVSRRFQTLMYLTFSKDTEPWNCRKSRFPMELKHNFSTVKFLIPWPNGQILDGCLNSRSNTSKQNFPYPISMISNLFVYFFWCGAAGIGP